MPRRRLGERRYSSYSFSTSALDGGESSVSRLGCSLALGTPETVWTQRLQEKIFSSLLGIEPQLPGGPACSHTLYCLSYPAYNLVGGYHYFRKGGGSTSSEMSVMRLHGVRTHKTIFDMSPSWQPLISEFCNIFVLHT
jgi:hypothetical protein